MTTPTTRPVDRDFDAIELIEDPSARIVACREMRERLADQGRLDVLHLNEIIARAIAAAREADADLTLEEIGEVLGVSRQRVHQLANPGPAGPTGA